MDDRSNKTSWLFNGSALISLILTILIASGLTPLYSVVASPLIAAFVIMAVILAARFVEWLNSLPKVTYYRSLQEIPKYKIANMLASIKVGKVTKLEVIARTGFRLLAGDEEQYRKDPGRFKEDQQRLHNDYVECLAGGGEIHFVLQNPNIKVPDFSDTSDVLLKEQALVALKGYDAICSKLADSSARGKVFLSVTDRVILSSMVRLTTRRNRLELIRDLSLDFKQPAEKSHTEGEIRQVEKPFLVFRGEGQESQEFHEQFNDILHSSEDIASYSRKKENGLQEVKGHIARIAPFHSVLRNDQSHRLACSAAQQFLAEKQGATSIPPVCIQFLVTNRCTTTCKMCSHYRMFDKDRELNLAEVKNVLRFIQHMGQPVPAVIISGGEPIAREDISDILIFAKNSCQLNLGLITNGIRDNGPERKDAIDGDLAKIIAQTCSWVQLSIDSLNPRTYSEIRGGDYLSLALESLNNILRMRNDNIALRHVEVCFTIQKDNFHELKELKQTRMLPQGVPVRLKFAHGPANGAQFLLEKKEVDEAVRYLHQLDSPFNGQYLLHMIQDKYFYTTDIARGTPLATKMLDYEWRNFVCRIMQLTCVIDAQGDVYPCCFLFDDNHSASKFRSHYAISSLRGPGGVVAPLEKNANRLREIWTQNGWLATLRKCRLPVNKEACTYCIRHFCQNELLNNVHDVFSKYEDYGVAEAFLEQHQKDLDTPYWL